MVPDSSLLNLKHGDMPSKDREGSQVIAAEGEMISIREDEEDQINLRGNHSSAPVSPATRASFNRHLSGGWSQSSWDTKSLK